MFQPSTASELLTCAHRAPAPESNTYGLWLTTPSPSCPSLSYGGTFATTFCLAFWLLSLMLYAGDREETQRSATTGSWQNREGGTVAGPQEPKSSGRSCRHRSLPWGRESHRGDGAMANNAIQGQPSGLPLLPALPSPTVRMSETGVNPLQCTVGRGKDSRRIWVQTGPRPTQTVSSNGVSSLLNGCICNLGKCIHTIYNYRMGRSRKKEQVERRNLIIHGSHTLEGLHKCYISKYWTTVPKGNARLGSCELLVTSSPTNQHAALLYVCCGLKTPH